MNKIKKIILVLMVTLLITACGNKNTAVASELPELGDRYTLDANTPAWELDTKEETTKLTWYVNADWWNDEFGNDVITKQIKKDLNVDIEFITGDDTNLNTYFAGEDLPDLITIFDSNSPIAKQAKDWAYSLNDLADKYDPYFYEVYQEQTFDWFQKDDGKTYGYPNYSNTQEDYDSGMIPAKTAFIVRQDVLDALPNLDFTTPEKFIDSMKEIQNKFPELTSFGFNSMTSGVGALGDVLQDMIGVPLTDKDGNHYNRNLDEEYLMWLDAFRQIHDEKMISDDSFADDGTTFEEKVKTGKYATMFLDGTPQQGGNLQTFASDHPEAAYVAVDALESEVYDAPTLNQSGITGWMVNFITNQNVDPIKSIQIFTYLLSEKGQILTTYGIEGETYNIVDGQYVLTDEMKILQENDSDLFKKDYRLGEFMFFGHDRYKALSDDSFVEAIKQMQEWGLGKLYPHFLLENIGPDQGTAEARTEQAVYEEWETVLTSLIRSKSKEEFDSLVESFKTFQEDSNWQNVVDIYNEKININKEKLGIE